VTETDTISDRLREMSNLPPGVGLVGSGESFDNRQGTSDVGAALKAKLEAAHAAKVARNADAVKWLDPSYHRAQAVIREAAAEGQRKAQTPPRLALRAAHERQGAAEAEVGRLEQSVARAREFRDGIGTRKSEIEKALAADENIRTSRLREALAIGEAPQVIEGPDTAPLTQAERELNIAQTALNQLEAELAGARQTSQRCALAVRDAATALLIDQAADIADRILQDDLELISRRSDLANLARIITDQQRHLAVRHAMPAQISRAITPADPVLTGQRPSETTNWANVFADLCRDPEGHLDLDNAPAA
jgi:hypothetical protein